MRDDNIDFLTGGGEMGDRTRKFDWSRTSLGPISGWPQGLKTAVQIMLSSRYAMWLGWGTEFVFFYNDAYAKMTLGPKHPWALGRPASEVWSEIWADAGPRAESVVQTGQATWDEGLLLFLERNGFPEETYHTFSYSPLPGENNTIGGILCVVTEDTERTIGERRLRTLRELAARTTDEPRSAEQACETAAKILAANPYDIPFGLIYLNSHDGETTSLAGAAGIDQRHDLCPNLVELSRRETFWPFHQVSEFGKSIEVDNISQSFLPDSVGVFQESPETALVLPLAKSGQDTLAGFLIAGISPRRPFDDSYRGFLELVAGQIATAVSNARAYEEEKSRALALEELDHAKTAFFSNVSHEFRTPLTLMLGPLEDILSSPENDGLSAKVKQQLTLINRNGLRLLRLVNSLLDFSRIEAGRVRAAFQPTDLQDYTSELVSVFRSAVERAGMQLNVQCEDFTSPVYVDRNMWEKIVLNLVSNAFKFTFEGSISVELSELGEHAQLIVRDTGTGIPSDQLPRLFDRFHRIENALGRTHEGSGIGLALVQELVKLHGGKIDVESELGQGSCFTILIPLGTKHLPPDQTIDSDPTANTSATVDPYIEEALQWLPEDSIDGPDSSVYSGIAEHPREFSIDKIKQDERPTIVLADDNIDMRQYVSRLLSDAYRVTSVSDGETAWLEIERELPDLVLTDVMMPKLDGFGLLARIRETYETRDLPVIMLSARAGEESRVEGMDAGADDYLVKPFSGRELLARVGAHIQIALQRKRSAEELQRNEERLQLALSAARMVAWQWNLSTDDFILSENAQQFFAQLATNPPVNKTDCSHLIHQDDRARYDSAITQAIQRNEQYKIQYRVVSPNNEDTTWIEETGRVVTSDKDSTRSLVGVFMDITQRREASTALQQERDLLNVTLKSIGDAVITTDIAGQIANLNHVAEQLTGWMVDEVVGKPLADVFRIINEQTRETVESPAERALREGVIVGLANHTLLISRDGTEYPIDDSAAPIRGSDGSLLGCVLVFRDVTARQQADRKLRESEERYRLIGHAANDAIWDWNLVNNQVNWNEGLQRRFGYPLSEIGNDANWWKEHIHPDDQDRVVHGIHAVIDSDGELWQDEYRYRRADGSYANVFDRGKVVRNEGKPVRMVGSMLDLTERLQAEQKLREQERQYRGIFESTSDAVLVFDYEGYLQEANPAACSMHGYSYAEFIGMHGTQFVHQGDHSKFASFVEAVSSGQDFHVEGRHVRKDGEQILIKVNGTGFSYGGKPALLAVVRDITEERQALQKLQESEEQLRLLAETIPQLAWMAGPNGDIFWYNSRWYEYTGKTSKEMEGWGWQSVHDPAVLPTVLKRWKSSLETGTPFDMVFPIQGADGEFRPFLTRINPLRDQAGNVRYWFGTNTDISEQQRIQEELRELAAQLSEADRRKDEFLATLAHELRNPLAPIRTGLELMSLSGDDPAKVAEVRPILERQTKQLISLVDDLLDVSRITRGKFDLKKCQVELSEVVRSAVEASTPIIDELAHNLEVSIPEQTITLEADPHRLAQVLANLLNNSAKYTPEGGNIQLMAIQTDGHLELAVSDNGIGIPEDMLGRIFDMFAQIDRPLERGYPGLGIGLTLVKSLIEMHEGTVAVESNGPNRGTKFTVRLPISPANIASNTATTDVAQPGKLSSKRRVLVVDDNKAAAKMLRMVVQMLGNEVETADDGLQAIEIGEQFRPQVIFMDIGMPKMNGYEAARYIREQPWGKKIVLIALTGWGQEDDKRKTKEAGFDHHLVKPAEPSEIQTLLALVPQEPT